MNKSYSFQSNSEPSDEQLRHLMQDVLKDVKNRAEVALQKFEALQNQQIKEIKEKYRHLKLENAD